MGLFDNIFTRSSAKFETQQLPQPEQRSYFADALNYNSLSSYSSSQSMRLSAVYACVNVISNSIASLPLNVYNIESNGFKNANYLHPAYRLLNIQPSQNLSRFNFFKLIVSSVLLQGNGYAIIERKGQTITGIKYIQPQRVSVTYNYINDKVNYIISGYSKPFEAKDILHFWLYSNDTVNGISTISYAVNTLKISADAENHASNFFKSGAATNGILKANVNLTESQKTQIRASWQNAFSDPNSNGVAIVPVGMEYESIAIDPVQAQLLDSRKFSVVEICRFFNVNPTKVYDLENSKTVNYEQVNLEFLQDSINPWLIMIEQEINRKIFSVQEQITTNVSFDRTSMLSTDKKAMAEYYRTMIVNGLMTINEIRKELKLNSIENGDELFMQLNMSTINNIVNNTPAPVNENLKQDVAKNDVQSENN